MQPVLSQKASAMLNQFRDRWTSHFRNLSIRKRMFFGEIGSSF